MYKKNFFYLPCFLEGLNLKRLTKVSVKITFKIKELASGFGFWILGTVPVVV
jgi:hypothetical protein